MAIANQRLKLALFAIVFVVISLYFISGRPELKNIAKVPESLPKPWNPLKPKLIEDAHSLANADDFLPHFKAVTALRGISFAEGKAGCNWENEGAVNFMYGNEADVSNTCRARVFSAREVHEIRKLTFRRVVGHPGPE